VLGGGGVSKIRLMGILKSQGRIEQKQTSSAGIKPKITNEPGERRRRNKAKLVGTGAC